MMVLSGASRSSLSAAHRRLQACLRPDPGFENADDSSTVWAMPIVLHIPRQDPPLRHELLTDAARAVVACCLLEDEDAVDALRIWCGARIRKVARRARNSQWTKVQSVPGATVGYARACVPSAVVDTHPLVQKLQISGTDVPASNAGPSSRPQLLINAALGMSVGKAAAQAGHAAMLMIAHMSEVSFIEWVGAGAALQVREVPAEEFATAATMQGAVLVRDAGYTEIAPGSVTAIALY